MKYETVVIPKIYEEPSLSINGYTFTALIAQRVRKFILFQYAEAWILFDAKNGHSYGAILGTNKESSPSELKAALEKESRALIDKINSAHDLDNLQRLIEASDKILL